MPYNERMDNEPANPIWETIKAAGDIVNEMADDIPAVKSITLIDGPMDGYSLLVYGHQTTASIQHDGQVLIYRECADKQWRFVPAMTETVGE
jgi:hypothetical protein